MYQTRGFLLHFLRFKHIAINGRNPFLVIYQDNYNVPCTENTFPEARTKTGYIRWQRAQELVRFAGTAELVLVFSNCSFCSLFPNRSSIRKMRTCDFYSQPTQVRFSSRKRTFVDRTSWDSAGSCTACIACMLPATAGEIQPIFNKISLLISPSRDDVQLQNHAATFLWRSIPLWFHFYFLSNKDFLAQDLHVSHGCRFVSTFLPR